MGLPSDSFGFLTGQPIELRRMENDMSAIRSDIRQIRDAVVSRVSGSRSPASLRAVAEPAGRSFSSPASPASSGWGAPKSGARSVADVVRVADAIVARNAAMPRARKAMPNGSAPAERDSRGRFVGGARAPAPSPLRQSFSGFGASSLGRVASSVEEVDPTVRVLSEVAGPLRRGLSAAIPSMDGKGESRGLRRFFSDFRLFRREETAFNKAANKSLKNIEERPENAGAGINPESHSLLSRVPGSGLLARVPLIGRLFGTGVSVPGNSLFGALRRTLSTGTTTAEAGAAGQIGKLTKLGRFLSGGGKLLRRVPLLGALLASIGAGADIYDAETDKGLSRQDKDKRVGRTVGGLGGTLAGGIAGAQAGAAIGTMFFPGAGTAVGGVIGGVVGAFLGDQGGQIIGEKFGAWVEDLRQYDIPGKITAAWDQTAVYVQAGWLVAQGLFEDAAKKISETWKSVTDKFDQISSLMSGAMSAVNQWIRDKTGFDVAKFAKTAKEAVVNAGEQALSVVGEKVSAGADAAIKAGSDAVDWAAKNTTVGKGVVELKRRWDEALGATSRQFESGRAGAAAVSSGKGDFGGASYGTYQLSSKAGQVQAFIQNSGYADQFAGLQPGTPEFNAKWKQIAATDQTFGAKQHDYIKATHYDPMMKRLAKGGLDLSGRGAAVQDAVWSTAVQFGAGSDLIKRAVAGRDVGSMSDADLINAIQSYKLANNESLFASSSPAIRASAARRAENERVSLLAKNAAPALASAPANPVPRIPQAGVVAEAPKVQIPLASNGGEAARPVVVVPGEVGQDVSDRRIAHAVTGGMSGG